MPSSEEALDKAEEPVPANGDKACRGDPPEVSSAASSGPEDSLASADELFDKGSKAIEDGDFVEAVDCLSRTLEIRVAHYGELAPECAISYYKYGCALLYKAQEETDPLGNVPKSTPRDSEKGSTVASAEDSGSSKASVSDVKQLHSSTDNDEVEDGSCENTDKNQEDENEGSDGEESTEADEEESDLDLAWKMLDVARAIVERRPEDTIEKVNILASLGEVSLEREDIEISLNDYLKALSILERLVEPDNRRIIELNFRICLVLEVGSKVEEAIPYCQKAISLCNSRLQRLRENVISLKGWPGKNVQPVPDSDKGGNQSSGEVGSYTSNLEEEIEVLSGISVELEKKLEDLQQAGSNPKSLFSEAMKMVASKSTSGATKTEAGSRSLGSSQMGAINGGFDLPTVSTAAANDSVMHLGVVGRGIKRAAVNPIKEEALPKRPLRDVSEEKADSSTSVVFDSSVQASDAPTK